MTNWQPPLVLLSMPPRVRGGNWGHRCGLPPQSMLNPFLSTSIPLQNATGHGGVPLGLWPALIGSFLRSQVALPVWRMLTSVFCYPCILMKSHTKVREHDTDSVAYPDWIKVWCHRSLFPPGLPRSPAFPVAVLFRGRHV